MKRTTLQEAGDTGEKIALAFLERKGLRLLHRQYRCKGGELDLVMLDGPILALIEVRLRADERFGGPAASVTAAKQKRLIVAGKHLLLTHRELNVHRARFDVVAIHGSTSFVRRIEWIKDAFRL